MLGLVTALATAALVADAASRPEVIIVALIDDLGFSDIQPHGPLSPTPHIGSLAAAGVELANMHAYKVCSPSRRSLLSGRFPVHINGHQAPDCSNFLPLEMTLLSGKLKSAGYGTHFIGKGHLGYMTTDHLPVRRGFDSHVGYLAGDQQYEHGLQVMCDVPQLANLPDASWCGHWPPRTPPDACHRDMWRGNATASAAYVDSLAYSTDAYAAEAVRRIEQKPDGEPLFVYLAWQAVHGPWVRPDGRAERLLQPDDPGYSNYCSEHPLPVPDPRPQGLGRTQTMRCQFGSMLKVLDQGMRNVTDALHARGLWNSTLLLMMSDNGGVGPGSNYPLRGQKNTPWQGGTRVAAYAAGGFVPPALRGGRLNTTLSFADVYPTLVTLAGGDPTDTVTLAGQPRPIDGISFWPLLLRSGGRGIASASRSSAAELHEYLPTTEDSIIWQGRWKLITSATLGGAFWFPPGGRGPNNTALPASPADWPCVNATPGAPGAACLICSPTSPCLFDLLEDEAERVNIAARHPVMVAQLAEQLAAANNNTYVDGKMSAEQLAKYDCVADGGKYPRAWWGNFTGPCCRPKPASPQAASRPGTITARAHA